MTDDQVELFSTPGCPHCRAAREYLSGAGLAFQEHDVSSDGDALQRMLLLGGQESVPTIKVGREVLVGFDREKLDHMLAGLRNA